MHPYGSENKMWKVTNLVFFLAKVRNHKNHKQIYTKTTNNSNCVFVYICLWFFWLLCLWLLLLLCFSVCCIYRGVLWCRWVCWARYQNSWETIKHNSKTVGAEAAVTAKKNCGVFASNEDQSKDKKKGSWALKLKIFSAVLFLSQM